MRKTFPLIPMVASGNLLKIDKVLLTYKLRATSPLPSIEIYGTTHDGITQVLCKEKSFRYTACNLRQKLDWIVDLAYKDILSMYVVINNYESIERLYRMLAVTDGATNIPAGDKATADTDRCVPFEALSLDHSGGVGANISITFNHDVDDSTISNVTLKKKSDGSTAEFLSSVTDDVLTMSPISSLDAGTTYIVYIPDDVYTDDGYIIEESKSFEFTTSSTPTATGDMALSINLVVEVS